MPDQNLMIPLVRKDIKGKKVKFLLGSQEVIADFEIDRRALFVSHSLFRKHTYCNCVIGIKIERLSVSMLLQILLAVLAVESLAFLPVIVDDLQASLEFCPVAVVRIIHQSF